MDGNSPSSLSPHARRRRRPTEQLGSGRSFLFRFVVFPQTPPANHDFGFAAFEQQKHQQRQKRVKADFKEMQQAAIIQSHKTVVGDEAKIAAGNLIEIEGRPCEHNGTCTQTCEHHRNVPSLHCEDTLHFASRDGCANSMLANDNPLFNPIALTMPSSVFHITLTQSADWSMLPVSTPNVRG
jgi:hypothetical protein